MARDPATGQPLTYPIFATDAAGVTVPIITTAGDYKYIGRLAVTFDKDGDVLSVDDSSGPVRVSGEAPDAGAPNQQLLSTVVGPVTAYTAGLAANVLAQSEVALERGSPLSTTRRRPRRS